MAGFTLRQLEIFAQVVEHGSFRRCAEHLGVSQVSVSEHIRELESRLGVKLFDRNAGGPSTLTPEGERAYRRVCEIVADVNDLSWEVSGARVGVRTRIGVAMYAYIMRYTREALTKFKQLHPEADVTVDLELATPQRLHERVQSREIDIAYFVAFDAHDAPTSELVRLERLAIFVSRHHPLAGQPLVTQADIRATPAIHLTPRNPLRIGVDRALEQAGCSGSPLALEADDYGLILTQALQGVGFICMFQAPAADPAHAADLVPLTLEHPLAALQIRQMTRHSARHDPLVAELTGALGHALKTG